MVSDVFGDLQKTCGTKFLPSWGRHLCKKGLLNLLAVGDTTYAYCDFLVFSKKFLISKICSSPHRDEYRNI